MIWRKPTNVSDKYNKSFLLLPVASIFSKPTTQRTIIDYIIRYYEKGVSASLFKPSEQCASTRCAEKKKRRSVSIPVDRAWFCTSGL